MCRSIGPGTNTFPGQPGSLFHFNITQLPPNTHYFVRQPGAGVVIVMCVREGGNLVPNPKITVPAAGAHGHTVIRNTKATDPVLMSSKHSQPGIYQRVPDVTIEIIVPRKEEPAALTETDRGDSTDNIFMAVVDQLLVGSDVKETARCVIAASCKGHPVREKGNSVDVGVVAGEGLLAHTIPDVPEFCTGITCT